jgi:hypothetical protein
MEHFKKTVMWGLFFVSACLLASFVQDDGPGTTEALTVKTDTERKDMKTPLWKH